MSAQRISLRSILCVLLNGFDFVHRAERMLRRRVERIELQGPITDVDEIVPRACGNEKGMISFYTRDFTQSVSAIAHTDLHSAAFQADKLVNVGVHLHTDISVYGDTHQRELHIPSRPERCAEILIHIRCMIDVENKQLASIVSDFRMLAAVASSHK